MNPTKQGLKLHTFNLCIHAHRSLSPWIQQNKDWNTIWSQIAWVARASLSPWIQQNKDWNTLQFPDLVCWVPRLSPWIQQNKDWNSHLWSCLPVWIGSLSPWIQQNKDWNPDNTMSRSGMRWVLAHESNKTRIETIRQGPTITRLRWS